MNRSLLRKYFIKALRHPKLERWLSGLEYMISILAYDDDHIKIEDIEKNITYDEYKLRNQRNASQPGIQFKGKYEAEISSLYWEFVFKGIIAPENLWINFKFTEYGKKWLETENDPIPEYSKDYIGFLRKIHINEIALDYIKESLATFNSKHYFASAVMLGVASERILLILAESMHKSHNIDTNEKKFNEYFKKEDTKPLPIKPLLDKTFEILKKNIKNVIPDEVHREAIDHIKCLIDVTRIQRNDAGHSRLKEMDREQLRLLLLAFPHACKRAYAFINWFKSRDKK